MINATNCHKKNIRVVKFLPVNPSYFSENLKSYSISCFW